MCDINSFCYKYQQNIVQENIFNRLCIIELNRTSIKVLHTFERIVNLCDNLCCTGLINNKIDAILQFYKFMNDEPFDFYDTIGEIREIMNLIFAELELFKGQLREFIRAYLGFIKKKYNLNEMLRIINKDFIKQMLYR